MTDEVLCPKCGLVPIPGCDMVSGHLPAEDGVSMRMCRNLFVRSLRMHLGKEISDVQHTSVSPLLERDADGRFMVDRTGDNLWIKGCTWRGLLPHLKFVLGLKGLAFSFRIITDQQIKDVFVGKERQEEGRSSLGNFVGDLDLVIIKLGYLGYKNKAAAGALKETLLIREHLGVPTWIVEDPSRPWTHSCDPDVSYYMDDQYEKVHIDGGDIGDEVEDEVEETFDDMGLDTNSDEEFEPKIRVPHSLELPGEDEGEDRYQEQEQTLYKDELPLPGENKEGKWHR